MKNLHRGVLKWNDDIRLPYLVGRPSHSNRCETILSGVFQVVGEPLSPAIVQSNHPFYEGLIHVFDLMLQHEHLNLHPCHQQAQAGAQRFELLLGVLYDDSGALHGIDNLPGYPNDILLAQKLSNCCAMWRLEEIFFLKILKQIEKIKFWSGLPETIK
jgi:hypothetical protein